MALLDVRHLQVHFPLHGRVWRRSKEIVKAVDDVSFQVKEGETVGLVGESGCGKSTLGRAVIRLVEPAGGEILFQGKNVSQLTKSELRQTRRQFQMVFQDPYSSLNPRLTVREIVGEALDIHHLAGSRAERRDQIAKLLTQVGLSAEMAQRYPYEFSGGQRQRIGIARALAVKPKFIVCDEPVSALDVSVQAQVVTLLQDLQVQMGIAYLFIAHDLAVVQHISQRVLVMYLGRIMESGPAKQVISNPKHPYTQALIAAIPNIKTNLGPQAPPLTGEIPSPLHPPMGCPFASRCPVSQSLCHQERPPFKAVGEGHYAFCHFA